MEQFFKSLRDHPVAFIFYLLFLVMWAATLRFSLSAPLPDRFNPLSGEFAIIPIMYALLFSSLFLGVVILKALLTGENKFYLYMMAWIIVPVLIVLLWLYLC